MVGNFSRVQIFAKLAKIQVSEIFVILIFAVSESGTYRLASGTAKCECLELCAERDGNLSSLFWCGKKRSLVARTFDCFRSQPCTAVRFLHLCLRMISWKA